MTSLGTVNFGWPFDFDEFPFFGAHPYQWPCDDPELGYYTNPPDDTTASQAIDPMAGDQHCRGLLLFKGDIDLAAIVSIAKNSFDTSSYFGLIWVNNCVRHHKPAHEHCLSGLQTCEVGRGYSLFGNPLFRA